MRINRHLHAREFRTPLLAPDAAESQEEPLLGSVAVDLLAFFSGFVIRDHVFQRHQRDARATVVGGVFAQRELAVEFQIVNRDKIAVFVGDATGSLFEFLAILSQSTSRADCPADRICAPDRRSHA